MIGFEPCTYYIVRWWYKLASPNHITLATKTQHIIQRRLQRVGGTVCLVSVAMIILYIQGFSQCRPSLEQDIVITNRPLGASEPIPAFD